VTQGRSHPFVVFGDDWGRHVSSMQHVFREIVPSRDVVWVNAIGHRLPGMRVADLRRALEKGVVMLGAARRSTNGRIGGAAPRAIVEPRVLPWHDRPAVQAFNRWSLARSIQAALRSLGASRPPVLVTGSPPSAPLVGCLGEVASVYFCMDDFSHLAGVSHGMLEPLEQQLLASVDVVVTTAQSLTRSKVPATGDVRYLPQGVNFDHFARPRPEPEDLRGLPRPLLGFAGALSTCCDLRLIRSIAEQHPGGSVVLVGPVTGPRDGLDLPNIHVLGARPYRELPAYVQHFDVGLIPYLINEWTRAVDPLKLLEYLAAGVPVVSTAIPEAYKYDEVVRIGEDPARFLTSIREALADSGLQARTRGQEVARQNTWSERARSLLAVVDQAVERRTSVPGAA
jgi:hypothetical protein